MAAAAEDAKTDARRGGLPRRLLRLTLSALPVVLLVLPGTLPDVGPLQAARSTSSKSESDDWRASGEDDLDIDRMPSDELAGDDLFDEDDELDFDSDSSLGFAGRSRAPVVSSLSAGGIPEIALRAYRRAEQTVGLNDPGCGLRWSLLAAIGRVETNHGRFGGAQLREDGYGTKPIRGIPLDGRPNVATIRDSDGGALDGDAVYDRAVGPMQFIPTTWRSVAVDGNGDGKKDPDNIFDAALGAAVYLCAGNADLRNPQDRAAAVRRYNNSDEYVSVVLALAAQYETELVGVLPNPGPALPAPPPLVAPPPGPANVGRPSGLVEVDPGGGPPGSILPPPPGQSTTSTTVGSTQPGTTRPPSSGTTSSSTTSTTTTTLPPCPTTTIPDPATTTTTTSSTSTTTTLPPPPHCPTTTTTTTTLPPPPPPPSTDPSSSSSSTP